MPHPRSSLPNPVSLINFSPQTKQTFTFGTGSRLHSSQTITVRMSSAGLLDGFFRPSGSSRTFLIQTWNPASLAAVRASLVERTGDLGDLRLRTRASAMWGVKSDESDRESDMQKVRRIACRPGSASRKLPLGAHLATTSRIAHRKFCGLLTRYSLN